MNREDTGAPVATPTRRTGEYLRTFFAEKALPERIYTVIAPNGVEHMIPSAVVVGTILELPASGERTRIAKMLARIDFANGDVHHFLEHLAAALAVRVSS